MASWLTGIASKATEMLESVDQATAVTLQTTQGTAPLSGHSRADSSTALSAASFEPAAPTATPVATGRRTSSVAPSAAVESRKTTDQAQVEADIFAYLNGKSGTPAAVRQDTSSPQAIRRSTSGAANEPLQQAKPPVMRALFDQRSAPGPDASMLSADALATENRLLKNEVAALTDEVSSFASRMRALQDTQADLRAQLTTMERREKQALAAAKEAHAKEAEGRKNLGAQENEIRGLMKKLQEAELKSSKLKEEKALALQDMSQSSEVQVSVFNSIKQESSRLAAELSLCKKELEESKARQESVHQPLRDANAALTAQLADLQQQLSHSAKDLSDMTASNRNLRTEIESLHMEFNEYKARAARVLQTKEKVIHDMRTQSTDGVASDTLDMLQAKRERDEFQEELLEAHETIDRLRAEVQDLERQQQIDAEMADSQFKELEDAVAAEKHARMAMEADLTSQLRECMSVRDEAVRAKQVVVSALHERENEASQLRAQASSAAAVSLTQLELENRLRLLTESLMQKQSQIEALSSDRSSLSLQLETERRRRDELLAEGQTRIEVSAPSGAPFEGARMRPIASLTQDLTSNPRISRRVTQLANALDSVSVRFGVFLRRYPVARVMVLVYMGLLHLWVMFVLLTYTPEIHESHGGHE
eukprot:m.894861 g.894861  ORF g.894861 m.894861 type:complete len:652 (-) comp59989_c0_seq9:52-2007(-)